MVNLTDKCIYLFSLSVILSFFLKLHNDNSKFAEKMGTELRHVQIYKLGQQNDSDYRV